MGVACCKEDCDRAAPVDGVFSLGPFSSDDACRAKLRKIISSIPLFKELGHNDMDRLCASFKEQYYELHDVLVSQGTVACEMFVILEGNVSVRIDDENVTSLQNGDYFGETSILRSEVLKSSIVANVFTRTFKLHRDEFQMLCIQDKLVFLERGGVCGGARKDIKTQAPSPKTDSERCLMMEALQSNEGLKNCGIEFSNSTCDRMIDLMWKEEVAVGTVLVRHGDIHADYFYIVQSGAFDVAHDNVKGKPSSHVDAIVAGGSFGELALLHSAPRSATVEAIAASIVWVIDRNSFHMVLRGEALDNSKCYMKYLDSMTSLNNLTRDEKLQVARSLSVAKFHKGERIIEQGELGEICYILLEGELDVVVDGKEQERLRGCEQAPQIFGERALLNAEVRQATVTVHSDTARTLRMDKNCLDILLGRSKAQEAPCRPHDHIHFKDLEVVETLGTGSFGIVQLVKHVPSSQNFALKRLSKGLIASQGVKHMVIREKTTASMCQSPFIIHLYECYNVDESLYMLFEAACGGELYALYNKKGLHGNSIHGKFYVASTILALEHMHERKIAHRDVKPENIVLTYEGQAKLTDMGFAKVVLGKTYTFCGTPDYVAPEIFTIAGHSHAADWYSLGILCYELMMGEAPFHAPKPLDIYKNARDGFTSKHFATYFGTVKSLEQFVRGCSEKAPEDRLPMRKGGVANLVSHSWYNGFDWKAMKESKMQAPRTFVSDCKGASVQRLAREARKPREVEYVDDNSGWDRAFATVD